MSNKINSVVVLMPNGRRHTFKVNLDSSLWQILEDVCKKYGYNSEEYALKHLNTILDPSSVIRYCSFPNNATLEMVQSTRYSQAGASKVILSLQVDGEDGRLNGEFQSDATLEIILLNLFPKVIENDTNKVPVIIYMRREIIGLNSFKTTTLRNLGLTSGRALLRLTIRDSEQHPELQYSGNVVLTKPTPSSDNLKDKEKSLSPSRKQSDGSRMDESSPPTQLGVSDAESNSNTLVPKSIPATEIVTFVQTKHNAIDSAKTDTRTGSITKQIDNKGTYKIAEECKTTSPTRRSPSPSPMKTDKNSTVRKLLGNLDNINLENVKFLEERDGLVFQLENTASSISFSQELPDSFFDVTLDDVKLLMRDLKRNRESMENAPLRTEALRLVENQQKTRLYKKTVLRIQFPDRLVLQGVFSPNDTVADVTKFVRNYLNQMDNDFYLYTSPPKKVLPLEKTLIDIGCVPCAKIYFAYHNQNSEAIDMNQVYLHDKVKPYITTQAVASLAAGQIRGLEKEKILKVEDIEDRVASGSGISDQKLYYNDKTQNTAVASSASTNTINDTNYDKSYKTSQSSTKSNQQGKVPKWFKPI